MKRRSFVAALLCFCMMCWVAMPCFVFGSEDASVEGSKTGPETVSPGETVSYTINAKVSDPITGLCITDELPGELEYEGCDVKVVTQEDDECMPKVEINGNELIVTPEYDYGDGGREAFVYGDEEITVTVTAKVKDSVAAGTEIKNVAVFASVDDEMGRAETTAVVIGDSPDVGDETGGQASDDDSVDGEYDDSPKCGDDFLDVLSFFREIWILVFNRG